MCVCVCVCVHVCECVCVCVCVLGRAYLRCLHSSGGGIMWMYWQREV